MPSPSCRVIIAGVPTMFPGRPTLPETVMKTALGLALRDADLPLRVSMGTLRSAKHPQVLKELPPAALPLVRAISLRLVAKWLVSRTSKDPR